LKSARRRESDLTPVLDRKFVLDDLLAPGLGLVFCGTAAGNVSARLRQYYAHPQNRFWSILWEIGLTPAEFRPSQYNELLALGVGLTDIAKYASGMDHALPNDSLGPEACAALRRRIVEIKPTFLAFTSLKAGRTFLGPAVHFGEQEALGATRVWVLPSPSPAARRNWEANKKWWRDLAEAAKPYLKSSLT
jgi:double-stranded uracil-DNA glycosylase